MSQHYRNPGGLSDDELQEIADRVKDSLVDDDAADALLSVLTKAFEDRIYIWLGKRFLLLILWMVGSVAAGAWAVLKVLQVNGVM